MGGICNKSSTTGASNTGDAPKGVSTEVRVAATNEVQGGTANADAEKEKALAMLRADYAAATASSKELTGGAAGAPKRRRSHAVRLTTYGVSALSGHATEEHAQTNGAGAEVVSSKVGGFAANVMGESKDQVSVTVLDT
jgi:hypothetical protein